MTAVNLFDDLEDDDFNPVVRDHGRPQVLNVATWLLTLGIDLVAEAEDVVQDRTSHRCGLTRTLLRGLQTAGGGQAMDIGAQNTSPEQTIATIERKSGTLVGTICELGARAAGGSEPLASAFRQIGVHLGVAAQLANDLGDAGDKSKGRAGGGASAVVALTQSEDGNDAFDAARLAVFVLARVHVEEAQEQARRAGAKRLLDIANSWLHHGRYDSTHMAA